MEQFDQTSRSNINNSNQLDLSHRQMLRENRQSNWPSCLLKKPQQHYSKINMEQSIQKKRLTEEETPISEKNINNNNFGERQYSIRLSGGQDFQVPLIELLSTRTQLLSKTVFLINLLTAILIVIMMSCNISILRYCIETVEELKKVPPKDKLPSEQNKTGSEAKTEDQVAQEAYAKLIQTEIGNFEQAILRMSVAVAFNGIIVILHIVQAVLFWFQDRFRTRFSKCHLVWIIFAMAITIHISAFMICDLLTWDYMFHNNHQIIGIQFTGNINVAFISQLNVKQVEVHTTEIEKIIEPVLHLICQEMLILTMTDLMFFYFFCPIFMLLANIGNSTHFLSPFYHDGTNKEHPERQRLMQFSAYLGIKIYPLWRIYNFLTMAFSFDEFFKGIAIARFLILEIVHFVGMIVVADRFRRLYSEVILQYGRIKAVEQETEQLLQKLPEGILIVETETKKVKFMNSELSNVLNLERAHQNEGLSQRIFRSYYQHGEEHNMPGLGKKNLHERGQSHPESPREFGEGVGLVSLQEMIDYEDWDIDQEKYFEMEVDIQANDEKGSEDQRVFTQIRRLDILYQEKPAKMLVIRNISFIIQYEKVKNENKYQELLTATMSHEMLTPLNSIINLSVHIENKLRNRFKQEIEHMAIDGSKGGCTSEIMDIKQSLSFIHIIKSSAHILQYLIKDLIDLMNIKLNRFNAVSQPFNPMEACAEVLQCFEVQARDKNLFLRRMVTRETQDKVKNILGDKQRYQQILLNIIQNGIKFSYVGGVEVILKFLSSSQLNLIGGCTECGLLITNVKDTGIGMEKPFVQKLFKLFGTVSKEQQQTMITTQGIGLGLTICRQLVEKLGGTININSVPGEGTEVSFSVPFKCSFCRKISHRKKHRQLSRTLSRNFESTPNSNRSHIRRFKDQDIFAENYAGNNNNRIRGISSFKPAQQQTVKDLSRISQELPTLSATSVLRKQPFGGDIKISHQANNQEATPKGSKQSNTPSNQRRIAAGCNGPLSMCKPSPRSEFGMLSDIFGKVAAGENPQQTHKIVDIQPLIQQKHMHLDSMKTLSGQSQIYQALAINKKPPFHHSTLYQSKNYQNQLTGKTSYRKGVKKNCNSKQQEEEVKDQSNLFVSDSRMIDDSEEIFSSSQGCSVKETQAKGLAQMIAINNKKAKDQLYARAAQYYVGGNSGGNLQNIINGGSGKNTGSNPIVNTNSLDFQEKMLILQGSSNTRVLQGSGNSGTLLQINSPIDSRRKRVGAQVCSNNPNNQMKNSNFFHQVIQEGSGHLESSHGWSVNDEGSLESLGKEIPSFQPSQQNIIKMQQYTEQGNPTQKLHSKMRNSIDIHKNNIHEINEKNRIIESQQPPSYHQQQQLSHEAINFQITEGTFDEGGIGCPETRRTRMRKQSRLDQFVSDHQKVNQSIIDEENQNELHSDRPMLLLHVMNGLGQESCEKKDTAYFPTMLMKSNNGDHHYQKEVSQRRLSEHPQRVFSSVMNCNENEPKLKISGSQMLLDAAASQSNIYGQDGKIIDLMAVPNLRSREKADCTPSFSKGLRKSDFNDKSLEPPQEGEISQICQKSLREQLFQNKFRRGSGAHQSEGVTTFGVKDDKQQSGRDFGLSLLHHNHIELMNQFADLGHTQLILPEMIKLHNQGD